MRRRVASARVGRLATLDAERRLHLVPICFALDRDTLYSAVDEKPKRTKKLKRLENIRAHSDVTGSSTTTRKTGRASGGCGCGDGPA